MQRIFKRLFSRVELGLYELDKDEDPFGINAEQTVVQVLEVRDGWVRYKLVVDVPDWAITNDWVMKSFTFKMIYSRIE